VSEDDTAPSLVPSWRFCVAPMMDRTDLHFRAMFRCISRHALLHTPMIAAQSIVSGRHAAALREGAADGPVALQLGGDEPRLLARAAAIAEDAGYVAVDLNCGCPSRDAARARWGAALMDHPRRVAEAVAAMRHACRVPITVKHRLGIAGRDDDERLLAFVDAVASAGAARLNVHARAAVLGRTGVAPGRVPPLQPDRVAALVRARPGLVVVDNGGITTLEAARGRLRHAGDHGGVMVGRAAYDDPYAWIDVDRVIFGDATPRPSRAEVAEVVFTRAARHAAAGGRAHAVTRHALGLWRGLVGARAARGALTQSRGGVEASLAALARLAEAPGADGRSVHRR
jgi:tRNA-dihydrouridine synthase A